MAMKRVYLSLICVASALISRLRPLQRLRNGLLNQADPDRVRANR
jgi:hypothetical protein